MKLEQFAKYKFRHSEEIVFEMPSSPVMKSYRVHCMLIGIDFEQELLLLIPIDTETYEENKFWARCEYCTKALSIKKNG